MSARRKRARRLTLSASAGLATLALSVIVPSAPAADSYVADPYAVSVVQTSADLTQHLAALPAMHFDHTAPAQGEPVININESVGYQKVSGFGGAMTDSSAWLIEHQLTAANRNTVMGELFGASGIHLNFVRVPIGASDYTVSGPYSYDDVAPGETDPNLTHFSIAHDQAYIVPALVQARTLNNQLQFLASPWSSPAWMKNNDAFNDLHERGTLRGRAYGPWAAYIVKFLQAYQGAGVPISSLTPLNEPGAATSYPGMNMSSASLTAWIMKFLVPALAKAHLHTRLYASDYGWGTTSLAQAAVARAGKLLKGLAWHCYFGSPDVMASLHSQAPTLDEIVDECSPGISALPTPEVVIASLRDWASTVALWNIALNFGGGPVQQPNTGCPGCYGLVKINAKTGAMALTSAYYQLGQASSFIQPGAQRVSTNNFVTYTYTKPHINFVSPGLDDVAFVNPDGSRVLLVYNNATATAPFAVDWHGVYFSYSLPAGATATFSWDRTAPGGGAAP